MRQDEKIRHVDEKGVAKEYTVVAPFDAEKARRAQQLAIQKRDAIAHGVEPFSVDEALKYYYPDELADSEERVRKVMAGFEADYYNSGAKTIQEWAEERERYDSYKDSTGKD